MKTVEPGAKSASAGPSESLLATVSASRVQLFHQCRLKFYFRHVLKLPASRPAALHTGSAVHHALQLWNRLRWIGIPIARSSLRDDFEQFWSEQLDLNPVEWESAEAEESERLSAWRTLDHYLDHSPIPEEEPVEAVEAAFDMDLAPHGLPVLRGFIDLVRQGGKIVDFKTTGQTPHPDRAAHLHELQLSCYGLLYRDATGKMESGFELHHLVKLKTPKVVVVELGPVTEAQISRLFRSMESYVQGVSREDWVPNPNPMTCACCEYFEQCRSWTGERVL
jgi:CRISPR/Cas system-associated exonuclease Cas4 (RecB family)